MGSETERRIPVINFNEENLKPGSDSWVSSCKHVRHAMEEYGCFEIVCDDFLLELHNSIFAAAKDLFDLPVETKNQKISDRPGSLGYVAERPWSPRYESTGFDSPETLQGAEYFTNLMWPQGNNTFRETVQSISKRLVEMSQTVMKMVAESYGVESVFDSIRESAFYTLRFFKYRTRRLNESDVGLAAHCDTSFLSILHQHQVEGLQIKTKDGQWIDVKPSPSSFVVLAGYTLMAWSNDRVLACEHKVTIKEERTRYSVGLFSHIKGVIHVPEEMVDEEHPLGYTPIDSLGFHAFRLSEEGLKIIASICFAA
ncbi:hypothetical protein TIFTF001_006712 [Ficus carica]|uniref:Fe2OG dioxygenase domain-containing protein n=1 Tax=Ficus carica TaxID=3494 RepID=A0AA88D140_FICCA|nr:hypothetical protein TIFTF001_006712 [Ficus carica]